MMKTLIEDLMKIADPKRSGFSEYGGYYYEEGNEHRCKMDAAVQGMLSAKLVFGTNNNLRIGHSCNIDYVGVYGV